MKRYLNSSYAGRVVSRTAFCFGRALCKQKKHTALWSTENNSIQWTNTLGSMKHAHFILMNLEMAARHCYT